MGADVDALLREAADLGVVLPRPVAAAMLSYLARVQGAPFNLSGIRDPEAGRRKHLVDAVSALPLAVPAPGERCLDIGSGGGFPGVPLAIACPQVEMHLLDATAKKLSFIERAAAELGVANVRIVHGRAEELGRDPAWRERYDCVLARAVARLPLLLEYALPFCRVGGRFIAFKGGGAQAEIAEAGRALHRLGGAWGPVRTLVLPEGTARVLVRVEKVRPTPAGLPRTGAALQRPL